MTMSINELKGMHEKLSQKLHGEGVYNTDQLLEAARTPQRRRQLANAVGVESSIILELANRADLSRIRGVAGVYSDLLEHAGVDTVKELAMRNPINLYGKIVEVNKERPLTKLLPTLNMIENWVVLARELPPMLEF